MSVQSCDIKDNVTGNDEFSKVAYSEEFKVIVQVGDQPATILTSNHPDVPQVGDPHPIDTRATVKSRSVKATKARELWILTVMYEYALTSGEDGGGGGGGGGDELQVLDIAGGVWYENYNAEQDVDNKAYINTAGDRIEKQASRPHPQFTIISRSQSYLVPDFIPLVNQVNKQQYSILGLSFPKKTLLFNDFNFKSSANGYWEYTFTFKARYVAPPKDYDSEQNGPENDQRAGGWTDYILNAGYREKRENGVRQAIVSREAEGDERIGSPVSSPWPLDGNGKAIPRGDFKDKAVWLEFNEYKDVTFNRKFRFNWRQLVSDTAQGQGFFNG